MAGEYLFPVLPYFDKQTGYSYVFFLGCNFQLLLTCHCYCYQTFSKQWIDLIRGNLSPNMVKSHAVVDSTSPRPSRFIVRSMQREQLNSVMMQKPIKSLSISLPSAGVAPLLLLKVRKKI